MLPAFPPNQISFTKKFGIILLTIFLFFITTTPFLTWTKLNWFLPEPHYTTNEYNQILSKELTLSLKNILIDSMILTLAFFITFSFLFSKLFGFSDLKNLFVCFVFGVIVSTSIVGTNIYQSMKYWEVLENAASIFDQKVYTRGRGGGFNAQKKYTITFVNHSDTAINVKNIVLPSLQRSGFSIESLASYQKMLDSINQGENFIISAKTKNYLNINLNKSNRNRMVPQTLYFSLYYDQIYTNHPAENGTTFGSFELYPND